MTKIMLLKEEFNQGFFLNCLSDYKIAECGVWIPNEILRRVGGIHDRLKARRFYELLLRIAHVCEFSIQDIASEPGDLAERYQFLEEDSAQADWDIICADCYLLAKYKDMLLQSGCFDMAAERILCFAGERGMLADAAAQMEQMLLRGKEYYRIDDATRPVLIYQSEAVCYNVLNMFAEQFGLALARAGQLVEYFDVREEGLGGLAKYTGCHFRAVVGIQTYLFSARIKESDEFLHDRIFAPKYNFILDHPVWMKHHLVETPQNFYVLTHDKHYAEFVETYFQKPAWVFAPAGSEHPSDGLPRMYDISFVGSYGDYWEEILLIHRRERSTRFVANRFLLTMRKHPNLTAEEAFWQVLDFYRIDCSAEEFPAVFCEYRRVIYCAMHYIRYRVVKELVEHGLRVDVFGNSWNRCALRAHSNLICHPDVSVQESVEIWQQSKLSLNIMSWHKSGFTERMAGIMLCKTVLVTDDTSYLDENYQDGRDLIRFRLDEIAKLPARLAAYLSREEELETIAANGYRTAAEHDTWDCRAKRFLKEILP